MTAYRNILVQMNDVLIREPKLIWRYYRPFSFSSSLSRNIFMVDGRVGHGGMFDRLKGIISVYAISKAQKKDFRIHFTYPFELEKYLEPNEYDWRIDAKDINYHFPSARPLFLYGECYSPRRLFKQRNGEAHFYFGYNILDEVNARYGTKYEWGQLYRELFRPTAYLQQYIDKYQAEIGTNYVVFHARFLNLLGDKVELSINPELPEAERTPLMQKLRDKMLELKGQMVGNPRIMLASDSMTFINYMLREVPDIYVVPGTAKHIDTAGNTDDSENIKMFLDYHLIAHASKVYNLVAAGMWPSAFPEYAAKIGNVEFERVLIDG